MNLAKGWILLAGWSLISACSTSTTKTAAIQYFSLPRYFNEEMPRLLDRFHSMIRVVDLNGHSDTSRGVLDSAYLRNCFQPFLATDLNKPALRGTYRTEDFQDPRTGTLNLVYTASGSRTQPYQVWLGISADHHIRSVYITGSSRNILYRTVQRLYYQEGQYIQIITEERMLFFAPRKISVKISFLN